VIAELKSLFLGLDGKASGFSKQLDTIETKITNMSEAISEVKDEVTSVKTDLKNRYTFNRVFLTRFFVHEVCLFLNE
jgi:hypothetical protein